MIHIWTAPNLAICGAEIPYETKFIAFPNEINAENVALICKDCKKKVIERFSEIFPELSNKNT